MAEYAYSGVDQLASVKDPRALSTTYSLALAPGLKKADGQPLEAVMSATIKTPPMQRSPALLVIW